MAEEIKLHWYEKLFSVLGGRKMLALVIGFGFVAITGKDIPENLLWLFVAFMSTNAVVHLAGALGKGELPIDDGREIKK